MWSIALGVIGAGILILAAIMGKNVKQSSQCTLVGVLGFIGLTILSIGALCKVAGV